MGYHDALKTFWIRMLNLNINLYVTRTPNWHLTSDRSEVNGKATSKMSRPQVTHWLPSQGSIRGSVSSLKGKVSAEPQWLPWAKHVHHLPWRHSISHDDITVIILQTQKGKGSCQKLEKVKLGFNSGLWSQSQWLSHLTMRNPCHQIGSQTWHWGTRILFPYNALKDEA